MIKIQELSKYLSTKIDHLIIRNEEITASYSKCIDYHLEFYIDKSLILITKVCNKLTVTVRNGGIIFSRDTEMESEESFSAKDIENIMDTISFAGIINFKGTKQVMVRKGRVIEI